MNSHFRVSLKVLQVLLICASDHVFAPCGTEIPQRGYCQDRALLIICKYVKDLLIVSSFSYREEDEGGRKNHPVLASFYLSIPMQTLKLFCGCYYYGRVIIKPPKPLKPHHLLFFLHPPHHSLCSLFWNDYRKCVCKLYKLVCISQVSSLRSVDFWTIVKYWATCRLIEKSQKQFLWDLPSVFSRRAVGYLWFREAFWIQVIKAGKLMN